MTVPYAFANLSGNIALAKLDSNFNTPITIGNTSVLLGNTVTTLNNLTLANVTITSGTSNVTNVNVTNVTVTNLTATLANVTTLNVASAFITSANIGTLALTNALSVSSGGTGQVIFPANSVLLGNGTGGIATVAPGTVGNVLTSIGGVWVSNVAVSGAAAGANTQIQYNSSNALAGSANLTFDGTNLGVGGSGDPFGRFYGRSVGLTSSSSAFFEINAATGSSSGIDFGVNASRTAGITSNTTETNFTTLGATPLLFGINGSEQMRLTSTGLGIGTSSPGYKLEVTGTAAISGAVTLSGGTASGVAYLNGSKVLTTGSALTFDGAGTLVSGAGGTGSNKSVWRLNGSDASSYGSYLQFQRNSVNKWTIGTDSGINGGTSDDLTIFGTASQRFYASSTEQMRLTSTGLGIGTSSPAAKLHVGGNQILQNTGSGIANNSIRWQNSSGTFQAGIASYFNTADTGNIEFLNGGTTNMQLSSSGNLGIGTTANASAILDAQSTTKGVRMPNMTTTQKNAISSPAAGLMVFDTTLSKLCVYTGAAWETITSV